MRRVSLGDMPLIGSVDDKIEWIVQALKELERASHQDEETSFDNVKQAATDSYSGTVELATTTEVLTGTDAARAVTPDAVAALWEKGADVASDVTISLGEGSYFHITGTATITNVDFATPKDGRKAILVFDGALTLTYNATTLVLPGATDITTAAGDCCLVVQDADDNIRVAWYMRADGTAVVVAPAAYAPDDADYIVATANGGLSAERVVTDSTTITRDVGTAGVLKLDLVTPVAVADGGTGQTSEAEALGEMTQALTEDTTPDSAADYLATYDASADTGKKVLLSRVGGLVLLTSNSVSSAATLDIVLTSYTAYRGIVIELINMLPVTDAVSAWLRVSTDGGANYDAGSSDYGYVYHYNRSGSTEGEARNDSTASAIVFDDNVDNAASSGLSATIKILDQTNTAALAKFTISAVGIRDVGYVLGTIGYGYRKTAQDTDAIRFMFSSGNISSGKYAVYGLT